jgi:hypothetical protein
MKTAFLLCLIAIGLSSCSVAVYSNYDRSTDFTRYKTFTWLKYSDSIQNQYYDNDITHNNIMNFANNYLYSVGYELEPNEPDLFITYHTMAKREMRTVNTPIYSYAPSYYSPSYGNYPYGYNRQQQYNHNNVPYIIGYNTQQIPYIEGTVIIDIVDRRTNQLVWRGWGESSISSANDVDRQLHGEINRIMAKYPVKPQKNPPTYSTYQK